MEPSRLSIGLLALTWFLCPPRLFGCGGGPLYLFWDRNCGSDDHHAGWILTPKEPDPTEHSNLMQARSGGCHNWANLKSDDFVLPKRAKWGSWDRCCTKEPGTYYSEVTIKQRGNRSVEISGLCDSEGGKKYVNGLYNISGKTTGGRLWYTSAEDIPVFEGAPDGGVIIAIILFVLAVIIGCIAACVSVYCCYLQKCCCFQQQALPAVITQPGSVTQAIVVGQPVQVEGSKPQETQGNVLQATVVQATVVQATPVAGNSSNEENPNVTWDGKS